MIFDRRTAARVKEKLYKMVVRHAMIYELETLTLTKRQEVVVADLKMQRFSLGVTRTDRVRNDLRDTSV